MASSDFTVTFYGCRGSFPVCGPEYLRHGGHTTCVVVRAGGREICLDAGSGIVGYGDAMLAARGAGPLQADLFFTHLHLDHLIGLPFFKPIYMSDATLRLWGPANNRFGSLEGAIDGLLQPPFFPISLAEMSSLKQFFDMSEVHRVYFLRGQDVPLRLRSGHPRDRARVPRPEEVEVEVRCMRGYNHPKSGVLIYRIEHDGRAVVFATDTEGFAHGDRRLIDFARGADVLIHDAMYTDEQYTRGPWPPQGYGHSTVEMAAEVAREAGVGQLVLFHHDPTSDDDHLDEVVALGRALFPDCQGAREGLVLKI